MFCFGAQNDPAIKPLRSIPNIPLKVAQIDMCTKTNAKQVEFFLRKWPKTRIFTQSDQKNWLLRSIFSTHLTVFAMSIWSNTDVKSVTTFWEMTKELNFDLLWDPKWPKNWAPEAHILHTTESTCNEHEKQYWCETNENFLRKWPKSRILTYFGVQNGPIIGPLRPILCISLKVVPMGI